MRKLVLVLLLVGVALGSELKTARVLKDAGIFGAEELIQDDSCECPDSQENECSCQAPAPCPKKSYAPSSCKFTCQTACHFERNLPVPPPKLPRKRVSRTCLNLCGGLCRQLCAKFNDHKICNGCVKGCLTRCELPENKPAGSGDVKGKGLHPDFVPKSPAPKGMNGCMNPCANTCKSSCTGNHDKCSGCVHTCFKKCAVEMQMTESEMAALM